MVSKHQDVMFEKGLADLPEFRGFELREINAEDFGAEAAGEGKTLAELSPDELARMIDSWEAQRSALVVVSTFAVMLAWGQEVRVCVHGAQASRRRGTFGHDLDMTSERCSAGGRRTDT